ncbi:putative F-box protein AUF1 [Helianthus debilis subsp. tardiflorus]
MVNLNPMPMLTSLTLELTILEDQHLNELNTCFPNLQVLNLVGVRELKDPKIHLLNLQTCHVVVYDYPPSLTLITPNLITLKIECFMPVAIHVEAPMLSDFHLSLNTLKHAVAFSPKTFEKLKTLWLGSLYTGSLLSEFPTTKTVETLTLDSRNQELRDARDSKLTIRKVFTVFPNVSSLCIYSGAWSELEACLNAEDWEILDGRKGLKTICAYLDLVDPSLTFSSVCRVLDQCVGLTDVSLLIHGDVADPESSIFMSKCMARWPGLKWRWRIWSDDIEDS